MAQQTQMEPKAAQQVRESSQIYTMLQGVLQARIAPLVSLRRSISDYSLGSRRQVTTLVMHGHSESENLELVQKKSIQVPLDRKDMGKRYARHGSDLLQAALAEFQFQDPQRQEFSRQLYINAASYVLQDLPPDLNEQEVAQLRRALPNQVEQTCSTEATRTQPQKPSILHRGVATSILVLCILLRIALPYIKYFLALAYNYERTHHVAEKALAMSMDTADSFGKRSIETAGVAMDNELIMSTVTYCVEGICGGLNEGLGQGMKAIEAKEEP